MKNTIQITKTVFFPIENGYFGNHLIVHQTMYRVWCCDKVEPLNLN